MSPPRGRNSGYQGPVVRTGRHPDDPFGVEQPHARPGRGRGTGENEANGPVDQCVARTDRRRASFDQRVGEQAIAGAAIDVFDIELLPPSHPFRTLDNVLATPHIGYVSHGLHRPSTRIPSRMFGSGSTPIRPSPSRLLCASTRPIMNPLVHQSIFCPVSFDCCRSIWDDRKTSIVRVCWTGPSRSFGNCFSKSTVNQDAFRLL
jgi:hypothetical protein